MLINANHMKKMSLLPKMVLHLPKKIYNSRVSDASHTHITKWCSHAHKKVDSLRINEEGTLLAVFLLFSLLVMFLLLLQRDVY